MTLGNYDNLVHIVDKFESTYYDNDEFKNGITFKDYGLKEFMTHKREAVSDAMIMCWNLDHKQNFMKYCIKKRVAVQAGGFNGLYPKLLGQMFESVYTFEPNSLNFHCLVNNCQESHIFKCNAVLGDKHMLVDVGGGLAENPGMFRVTGFRPESKVPRFRIDDLALNACDLIQLDVEGQEIAALTGAMETIQKYKPIICCEAHMTQPEEMEKLLSQFGYKEIETLRYAGDRMYGVL